MKQPFSEFLAMFDETQMTKEATVVFKTKQKNTVYRFDEALSVTCQRLVAPHGFHVEQFFSVRYEHFNRVHNSVYTTDDDFYITLSYRGCSFTFYIDLSASFQRASIRLTEIQSKNNETYFVHADFHDSAYAYLMPAIRNMAEVLKIFLHTSFWITKIFVYLD